jgi:hypothetical protein
MENRILTAFLVLIMLVIPAQGMKRTLQTNSEQTSPPLSALPEDVFECILSLLPFYDLKAAKLVGKHFNRLVSYFLQRNPISVSIFDKEKELLKALQGCKPERVELIIPTLPQDMFECHMKYQWIAYSVAHHAYHSCADEIEKQKFGKLRSALFKDYRNYPPTNAYPYVIRKIKNMPIQAEVQQHLENLEKTWQERHKELPQIQRKEFALWLQDLLYFVVTTDDDGGVDKLLPTISHFMQGKYPITYDYCTNLMYHAMHYATPRIADSLMKWILKNETSIIKNNNPLTRVEKSTLYFSTLIRLTLLNKSQHLDTLLSVDYLEHLPPDHSLLFYLALIKGHDETTRILIEHNCVPSQEIKEAFTKGTLFSIQNLMNFIVHQVIALSQSDSTKLIMEMVKDEEFDLMRALADNKKFQPYIRAYVVDRLNMAKELNTTEDADCIGLLNSVLSSDTPFKDEMITAIFSCTIDQFKTVFKWPAQITDPFSALMNAPYPHILLLNSILLLNRVLYQSLLRGRYDCLEAILNENWLLESCVAAAVFDDWTKHLTTPDTHMIGKVIKKDETACNNQLNQYNKVLQVLPNVPDGIQKRLRLMCLFNVSVVKNNGFFDPFISWAPPSTHAFVCQEIWKWRPQNLLHNFLANPPRNFMTRPTEAIMDHLRLVADLQ